MKCGNFLGAVLIESKETKIQSTPNSTKKPPQFHWNFSEIICLPQLLAEAQTACYRKSKTVKSSSSRNFIKVGS